ncbi:MAG: hypothetical protein WKF70_10930 [Chitinophagaceae bacterium]
MMPENDPLAVYRKRIDDLSIYIRELKKKRHGIAWGRFACLLAIIACFYYIWPYGLAFTSLAVIFCLAIFLRLVIISVNNNELIAHHQLLVTLNQQEIQIAAGNYTSRPDGTELLPSLHDYAHDMDIFGRASLYQYINRTSSEQGHHMLANWLLAPAADTRLLERQQAVNEISTRYKWRQQLQAFGMINKITLNTQKQTSNWLAESNEFSRPLWKWVRFAFPAFILTALLICIAGFLPSPLFYGLAFIFLVLSLLISRKVVPAYLQLDKIVKQITTLSKSIECIEGAHFESPLLIQLQQQFKSGLTTASNEVKALKNILERLDYRLNPLVFIPLNTLLFWDLQQVLALENWKKNNRENARRWFDALGEIEALSTIAALRFNNPAWTFPVFSEAEGVLIAEELGHPLIASTKRVTSSFASSGKAKIALVTGSNMAGKSTFLRSVGVNIILAMMGAPVCAKNLTLSPMRIISSMRISDNLEQNTSTFYAELKKLKHIIEAVNQKEKIFLLLDEILRGTNSLDRQIGSKALIEQLIRQQAVGMLATHDLELAQLVNQHPGNIHNYHFDVQVAGDELYFDYKLKEGVCTSLNASILMKKIGIEL